MIRWVGYLAAVLLVGAVAQCVGLYVYAVVGTDLLGWVLAPGLSLLQPDAINARFAAAALLDAIYYGVPLVWWWRRSAPSAGPERDASRPAV